MDEYERQWLSRKIDELEARLADADLGESERDYCKQECKTYRQWLTRLEAKKDKS